MRILITGASGQLGSYLLRQLAGEPRVTAWSRRLAGSALNRTLCPVDLTKPADVRRAFSQARPDVVIHAAAVSVVSACHAHPEQADAVNVEGTRLLAELSADAKSRLILTSTDLVFDGLEPPYSESALPRPVSVYGRTKQAAEEAVNAFGCHVVVRLALLYGPSLLQRDSFFERQRESLRARQDLRLFRDEWRTPLGLKMAADELLRLAKSDFVGTIHLGGPERMSRLEMGQRLAAYLGIDAPRIVAIDQAAIKFPEPRPPDVSLDCTKWRSVFPQARLLNWETSLQEMGVS